MSYSDPQNMEFDRFVRTICEPEDPRLPLEFEESDEEEVSDD